MSPVYFKENPDDDWTELGHTTDDGLTVDHDEATSWSGDAVRTTLPDFREMQVTLNATIDRALIAAATGQMAHAAGFAIDSTNAYDDIEVDWRDPATPPANSMADWIKEHLGFHLLPSQRYWLNATVIDHAAPPRKRKGLTGKAYRIARRRYARQRRLGTLPKIYRNIHVPNARINLKEI